MGCERLGVAFLCGYGKRRELVQMAKEEHNLTKTNEIVESSYPLPEVLLKEVDVDTPPTFISSDRKVHSLIQFCREHVVRLCASTRFEVGSNYGDGDEEMDRDCNKEEEAEEEEEDADEEDEEEVGEYVNEEFGEGWVKADHAKMDVKEEVYEDNGDYCYIVVFTSFRPRYHSFYRVLFVFLESYSVLSGVYTLWEFFVAYGNFRESNE